jgi:hypothetical protein
MQVGDQSWVGWHTELASSLPDRHKEYRKPVCQAPTRYIVGPMGGTKGTPSIQSRVLPDQSSGVGTLGQHQLVYMLYSLF